MHGLDASMRWEFKSKKSIWKATVEREGSHVYLITKAQQRPNTPKEKSKKKREKKLGKRMDFFWGGSGSECLMLCIVLVADDTWLTHMQAFVGAHCNRPTEAHGPRGKRKFIGPPYPLCRCSKIYPPFFSHREPTRMYHFLALNKFSPPNAHF